METSNENFNNSSFDILGHACSSAPVLSKSLNTPLETLETMRVILSSEAGFVGLGTFRVLESDVFPVGAQCKFRAGGKVKIPDIWKFKR